MKKNIFNSFFIEIFVSKFFSKVSNKNFGEKTIKYIIFHQDHKKDLFGAGLEPSAVFRCNACTLELVILAVPAEVCNV